MKERLTSLELRMRDSLEHSGRKQTWDTIRETDALDRIGALHRVIRGLYDKQKNIESDVRTCIEEIRRIRDAMVDEALNPLDSLRRLERSNDVRVPEPETSAFCLSDVKKQLEDLKATCVENQETYVTTSSYQFVKHTELCGLYGTLDENVRAMTGALRQLKNCFEFFHEDLKGLKTANEEAISRYAELDHRVSRLERNKTTVLG